jgi:tRNA-2-methylthio-N6-dimethylallyladenosine synthase
MNRGYTRETYQAIVEKLRRRAPDMALSTDILCGFPGETDKDHAATLKLVREVEFDSAFMFVFSPRSGTKAAAMEGQLDRAVKVARVKEVIAAQMDITRRRNTAYIGKTMEVLVEGASPRDPAEVTSRTRTFKNVILHGYKIPVGRFLNVKILDSSGWALRGAVIEK